MPGTHWSDKEKKALRRQFVGEQRDVDDIKITGRSRSSIRSQAIRMGLLIPGAPKSKWSRAQRRQLKKLQQEGFTPKEICDFELLGEPFRSIWAIRKQWGRMKLSDRRLARRMRNKKMWKGSEKKEFHKFLLEKSKTMTPEEIGKHWGVARSTVARWQTELGVKQPRDKVMKMDYSLAKQRRARKRIRRQNIRRWAIRRAEKEAELKQLADDLRSRPRQPQENTCTDCGRAWPKRQEFFHYREKKTSFGTSRYYRQCCRLCANARRRHLAKAKNRRAAQR